MENSRSNEILSFAKKHLGDYRIRNNQIIPEYCPFCHGGDNGDKDTFAVGLHNGAFSCLRGSCNVKGSFRELCQFFGETPSFEISEPMLSRKKVFDLPDPSLLTPLTDAAKNYFALRKISEETLSDFSVSSDDRGNIVFPFYENRKLTFLKYRLPRKFIKGVDKCKEWSAPNCKHILFGMDNVSFHKPLVITEGEIDALSVYEAGYKNVVSVPCGCNDLDFVELCWDWLEKFDQIILFGDNDEPGTTMITTLMRRLGEDRCLIAPEYPPILINGEPSTRLCKDANEILYFYGKEKLLELIRMCEPAPIKGVLNLADVPFVDPLTVPRILTGIKPLDNDIGGLGEGEITVFTGKRGEGKSTLNGQILLSAIEQGYDVCAYSGELSAYKFLEWIFLQATEDQYIGYTVDPKTGKIYPSVSEEIQKEIRKYIDGKFYLFDNAYIDDTTQTDAVLKVFTMCARRYNCKLFLVDNLMSIINSADEETKAQARFASALKAFAVKYKVHVILVAHPRKTKQGEVLTNDDVSGSSATTNLADNVISVEKPNLRITKNRNFGILDLVVCNYNPVNRRIYENVDGYVQTRYGWNHSMIKEPLRKARDLKEFEIQTGANLFTE